MGTGNLSVKVNPGAGYNQITGYSNGILEVKVKTPPVEGKANTELVKYLAYMLKVRKSDISIVRGARSRNKIIRVENMLPEEILRRLGFEL